MLERRCTVSSTQIKICGITNHADALEAIQCGAHSLGFNLYPGSRRCIDLEPASEWISQLPPDVRKVAVLVSPTLDEAVRPAKLGLFDSLQLHGNESPEFCRQLAVEEIAFTKALPATDQSFLRRAGAFGTDSILLDSSGKNGFGGSGET